MVHPSFHVLLFHVNSESKHRFDEILTQIQNSEEELRFDKKTTHQEP